MLLRSEVRETPAPNKPLQSARGGQERAEFETTLRPRVAERHHCEASE
jgi:hypothetical protein